MFSSVILFSALSTCNVIVPCIPASINDTCAPRKERSHRALSLISYLRHPQESLLKDMNSPLINDLRLDIKVLRGTVILCIFSSERDRNCLVADLAGSSHDVAALVTFFQLRT
jgi:hypothetical protein